MSSIDMDDVWSFVVLVIDCHCRRATSPVMSLSISWRTALVRILPLRQAVLALIVFVLPAVTISSYEVNAILMIDVNIVDSLFPAPIVVIVVLIVQTLSMAPSITLHPTFL